MKRQQRERVAAITPCMIRMIQSISAQAAKEYFNEALLKSDYYVDDQELRGSFHGKLAKRMKLKKLAEKDIFQALCENIHPITGEKLTARKAARRTVGYDINFHCPKSVSILHILAKDNHILDAFAETVNDTMSEIELDSKTRVRKKGHDEDRETGELVWGSFVHQTARPVDDSAPDPHLHCHCFTFNMTWDKEEQCYKAAQFRNIKRDMPYYQAKFHKNLSDRLMTLGYGIRKTSTAFEIEGVPQDVIDLFSKRTNEIGQFAKENNIQDKKALDKIGAKTRAKKQKGFSMSQLKKDWKRQIKEKGLIGNEANGTPLRHNPHRQKSTYNDTDCVKHSVEYCFERASVVQDRRILERAFAFAIGHEAVHPEDIEHCFLGDPKIIKVKDPDKVLCTTLDVVEQERKLIILARNGMGVFDPLYASPPGTHLAIEQDQAIRHLLTSPDQVSVIQGRAGTGKTTLMKSAISLIESTGKSVTVVAPTAAASRGVLKDEGFESAETVAKLLNDPDLQSKLFGQVLWVDEAGLLGTKDMLALLTLAAKHRARVILSGDTRQHSSVARGDALRVLIDLAGVKSSSLTTIYRQKKEGYRKAVSALSKGDMGVTMDLLEELKSIHEAPSNKLAETISKNYVNASTGKRTALAICPTHKESEAVSDAIRKRLKEKKRIGKRDRVVPRYINLNLTETEKSDIRNYEPGLVLQFNQNDKGLQRGSVWSVESIHDKELLLCSSKNEKAKIAVERKNKFDVFRESDLSLANGDQIRITRNGFDMQKKRLNNGQVLKVKSIGEDGKIVLAGSQADSAQFEIPENFGHLTHGYCMTSHASQGKTVDHVFIYQPSGTFPATDMKQLYVSVSRGRETVQIYTDDKATLIDHASKMRNRQSGLELLEFKEGKQTLVGSGHTPARYQPCLRPS